MTLNKDVANDIVVGKKLISINTEILNEFDIDEIRESFLNLESIFKNNFPKLFPNKTKRAKIISIDNTSILNSLIELSKNLSRLKNNQNCHGLEEHIKEYNDKNKLRHNCFVTLLAGFLISKVDSLELEPISRNKKRSDIKIKSGDIEIYIEHESININKYVSDIKYLKAHEYFATLLIKYLKELPYGIDIIYECSFSLNYIEDLCKRINSFFPSVKSEGTIINDDYFNVHVTRGLGECKEHASNIGYLQESGSDDFYTIMAPNSRLKSIIKQDIGAKEIYNKCRYGTVYHIAKNYIYPMHQFFLGTGYITISGPKLGPDVDFKLVLKKKIEYARAQAPINKPYVLALNMEEELGGIEGNRKILENIFHPDCNTRYNGILLVNNNFDFEFIPNPYAKLDLIPFFSTMR